MRNSLFNQLIYFVLIATLISAFCLFFKEAKALSAIPGQQPSQQDIQEQTKEEQVEETEQAAPQVLPPQLKEESFSERKSKTIIFWAIGITLFGIVGSLFIYLLSLFRKRKK